MGSNGSSESEPETWLGGYCSRKLGELERASAEEVLLPPLAIAMIMGAGTLNLEIFIFIAQVIFNPKLISVDFEIQFYWNISWFYLLIFMSQAKWRVDV